MTNTEKIGLAIIAAIIAVFGFAVLTHKQSPVSFGGVVPINKPLTSGAVLCGNGVSTLLVATSTSGRNFMTISNASGINVFLGFGYSATNYQGTMLAASSTLTLNNTGTYTGAIYCSALGGTATTTYSDSNS